MTRHEPNPSTEEIYDLLYRLGLTATSTAFFHLAYTVRLVVYQPQRLLAPTWLYPETAQLYRTNPEIVEQNIQRLSIKAWKNEPERLSQMAGIMLLSPPSSTRFLAILANNLKDGRAA